MRLNCASLWLAVIMAGPAAAYPRITFELPQYETPEDNAWDHYLAAFELLPEADLWTPVERAEGEPLRRDVRALLEAGQPALAKLREGLGQPCVRPRDTSGDPLPDTSLMHENAKARSMARLLRWEGWLHGKHGDYEEAFCSQLDAIAFGQDVARHGVLIDKLVSIACESIACAGIRRTVGMAGDGAGLAVVVDGLSQVEAGEVPYWEVLTQEYLTNMEFLRWVRGEEGGKEWTREDLQEEFGCRATGAAVILTRRESDRWYSEAVEMAKQEPWQWRFAEIARPAEDSMAYWSLPPENAEHAMRRHLATLRGTLLVAALALHHAGNGEYPAKVGELVPGVLEQMPLDPWTGEPFHYAPEGDSYELYSLGPNRADDGGVTKPWGDTAQYDLPFSTEK